MAICPIKDHDWSRFYQVMKELRDVARNRTHKVATNDFMLSQTARVVVPHEGMKSNAESGFPAQVTIHSVQNIESLSFASRAAYLRGEYHYCLPREQNA